jgi:spermidine synthase
MRFWLLALCLHAYSLERFEESLYPAWKQSFEVSRVNYSQKTDLCEISLFENPVFGKVLAIDSIIQLTEADEGVYSEMMAHVPLLSAAAPTSVLIIGGGDGAILREVLRHSAVKRAVLVEIDPKVIELTRQFMPNLSKGAFSDPRTQVVIQDAAEYVKKEGETFDVIICDSTDPVGPGKVLFTSEFYGNCKKRLKKNGIFVNQNGVPFLQKEELALTLENRSPHFKHVGFYTAAIPTYVGGLMAIGWASDRDIRRLSSKKLEKSFHALGGEMKYYTPEIHKASFALPKYMH